MWFWDAEGLCGSGGSGSGCVPRSVRQALWTEHFLNQTLLLPCVHPPRACTFYVWGAAPQWKDLIVILVRFKKSKRNTQFLKQTEPERVQVAASRAYP